MSEKVVVNGGMGLFGWLTVLFVGLKLMGFIDWPWLLVLLPFWGPIVILLIVALIAAIIGGLLWLLSS